MNRSRCEGNQEKSAREPACREQGIATGGAPAGGQLHGFSTHFKRAKGQRGHARGTSRCLSQPTSTLSGFHHNGLHAWWGSGRAEDPRLILLR